MDTPNIADGVGGRKSAGELRRRRRGNHEENAYVEAGHMCAAADIVDRGEETASPPALRSAILEPESSVFCGPLASLEQGLPDTVGVGSAAFRTSSANFIERKARRRPIVSVAAIARPFA